MGHITRLSKYALRYRVHFFGFMGAAAVAIVFNLLSPLILANIVDLVTNNGPYDTLIFLALVYLMLIGCYGLFDFVQRYASALMAQHVVYDLRRELYESLMEKDLAFYDDNETGQLLARVTTDVTTMREFLMWGYRVIFIGGVTLIGTYYVMWIISPELMGYMLFVIPALLYFIYAFAKKVRPVYFASRKQYGALSAVVQENVVGMKVVQSYATMDRESRRVEKENREYLDLIVGANRLSSFYAPLLTAVLGTAAGALIYIGGVSFSLGNLTFGQFVGFIYLVGNLGLPARFLSWGVGMYQRASAAADRTFYILDARDDVMNPEFPAIVDRIEGKIEFEHIYFSYRGDNWILRDVNFTVEPGQIVALLGGTGSGKTSIVNLLPRFYDVESQRNVTYKGNIYRVTEKNRVRIDDTDYTIEDGFVEIDGEMIPVMEPGSIKIDGIDVRDFNIDQLRTSIGMVHQDPFLFSASIRENIAFARPDASMEEVEVAAKAANIHDFIMTLDEGYEAIIGERGVTLSGGQKQRIAIARALLANPRILILDDSTSSIDARTEMEIQQALENLMKGRTTFIITHRLSTIRNAGLILILQRGRIVDMGSHDELIQREGAYADLFQTLSEMELVASTAESGFSDDSSSGGATDG